VTLAQRTISLIVSREAREVLSVSAGLPESDSYLLLVDETDDLGLWARVEREDGEHLVLIRWEYVLAIDVEVAKQREFGFQQ